MQLSFDSLHFVKEQENMKSKAKSKNVRYDLQGANGRSYHHQQQTTTANNIIIMIDVLEKKFHQKLLCFQLQEKQSSKQ